MKRKLVKAREVMHADHLELDGMATVQQALEASLMSSASSAAGSADDEEGLGEPVVFVDPRELEMQAELMRLFEKNKEKKNGGGESNGNGTDDM